MKGVKTKAIDSYGMCPEWKEGLYVDGGCPPKREMEL